MQATGAPSVVLKWLFTRQEPSVGIFRHYVA
jgi:hypothetical protein